MPLYRFLRFPEGKLKAVTFSYDDGVKQDIRLAEIFNAHGLKGTFNVNSSRVRDNSTSNLGYADIREHILGGGHEVAVHGACHRAPALQRTIDGIRDVLDCRLALEGNLSTIVRGMAYPDSGIRMTQPGTSDYAKIREYLSDLGIVYSRTLGGDNDSFDLPTDPYAWMPTAHHNNPKLFEYIEKFNTITEDSLYISRKTAKLFYVWGHSYEFDNNNNWDRIESACELLGGKNDVWYATNIEIHDYIEAYKSLHFSADERLVYNPTLQKVWFFMDNRIYSVSPGETVALW
jgi:peptidoglycan/xylan/chitin deacetylase (PgdA/CDA1 family)